MQSKINYENKEFESRRKKNQSNFLNNNFNPNPPKEEPLKTNNYSTINNNLITNGYSSSTINPSPRVKDMYDIKDSFGNPNFFSGSTKFSNFQPEANPASIFGKEGSRRTNKNKDEAMSNVLMGGFNESLKNQRKNLIDK